MHDNITGLAALVSRWYYYYNDNIYIYIKTVVKSNFIYKLRIPSIAKTDPNLSKKQYTRLIYKIWGKYLKNKCPKYVNTNFLGTILNEVSKKYFRLKNPSIAKIYIN